MYIAPHAWHWKSTSSPRRCTSAACPAVFSCFRWPLQSLFFSLRSLQTVCALVMRLGTAGDGTAGEIASGAELTLADIVSRRREYNDERVRVQLEFPPPERKRRFRLACYAVPRCSRNYWGKSGGDCHRPSGFVFPDWVSRGSPSRWPPCCSTTMS